MATAVALPGRKWRLYRSDGTVGPSRFKWLCLVNGFKFPRNTEFEDVTAYICDAPGEPAVQTSTPRLKKFEVNLTGVGDFSRIGLLEDDYDGGTLQEYQILVDETALGGGRTYTFSAYIENIEVGNENAGAVNFTCKLRGQGNVTRALVV